MFLRTGEYEDGSLGEFSITMPRENATVRALMDAVSTAISIGLQHGVPLDAYVEQLINSKFAPHGNVEGDPLVAAATSPLDCALRHLAGNYLAATTVPSAELEPEIAVPSRDSAPLLPLDLPSDPVEARRRGLRLVSDRKAS
jgi:hypothetical protein